MSQSQKLQSAAELLMATGVEVAHCRQVAHLAGRLFDAIRPLHRMTDDDEVLLLAAGLLHDVGVSVSYQGHHKHSQEIILHADLAGFARREQRIVACLARYHRKAHPSLSHSPFGELNHADQDRVRKLAALLRIADGLDRTHCDAVTDLTAGPTGPRTWEIRATGHTPLWEELWAVRERKSALFCEVFGVKLDIVRQEPPDAPSG